MRRPLTNTLTRPIKDRIDEVTLCTRDDVRRYIEAIPAPRRMTTPWHVAKNLLKAGAKAESVTSAIELALKFEARLEGNGPTSRRR